MAVTKIWDVKSRLDHVISYVKNSEKTEEQLFITGLNCHPETAREEMLLTKRQFQKTEGILAFHAYQSFAYGEVTPEAAHEIGVKLAQELWGDRFEVVVTTHLDKAHLHNHFVLNSVSFLDGRRYYDTHATYGRIRQVSDRLCREYQLSVVEHPQTGRRYSYAAYLAKTDGRPTWHGEILADLEAAIQSSRTMHQFYHALRELGYTWKPGAKYFTLRPPGKERFVRIDRKHPEYSVENIRKRIMERPAIRAERGDRCSERKREGREGNRKYRSARPKQRRGGFRGLYLHYCYLMGIFPQKGRAYRERLPFVLREDVRKLEQLSEETRFLCRKRIDTKEQLKHCQQDIRKQMQELEKSRKQQKNRLRSVKEPEQAEAIKSQIKEMTQALSGLKRDEKLCVSIAGRREELRQKLRVVREEKESETERKERRTDEHIR